MTHSHRRTSFTVVLLVAVITAAATAAACSAQATLGSSASGTPHSEATAGVQDPSGGAAVAKAASGADMTRILNALGFMQAVPPGNPVVVLLGGSAARESTISDASWRSQIKRKGGPADVLAWNMGSRNRTMAQNIAIVEKLPDGAQAIVYIGINLGSFTSAQKSASVSLPAPLPTATPSLKQPHSYSYRKILSKTKKRALVKGWLADRYPVFRRNFTTSAAQLEKLIRTCQDRGYYPVLFELPRNTAVIGSSLNAPTAKYRAKCRALAAKYGITWVSFVSAAKLPDSSFYDLWHLVEPGRKVWQGLLSSRTVKILNSGVLQDGGGS